jgi:tetratricopeptide (TPR) repeat protein
MKKYSLWRRSRVPETSVNQGSTSLQQTIATLPNRPKVQASTSQSSPPSTTAAPQPPPSSSGTSHAEPRSSIAALKKDYWQLAVQQLHKEDVSIKDQIADLQPAAVTGNGSEIVVALIEAAELGRRQLEEKRWKVRTTSRDYTVRDQIDRLLKALMLFKDIGAAAGGVDPLHAGLPLAGFTFLIQMATNDSTEYAAMVAGVAKIVTILARYQQIEALYLARPGTSLKQEFEQNLVSLYANIIRYQLAAACYYRRNTMERFLRSIPRLDDMSDVLAAVRRHDTACRDIGQVFDSSDALQRHQEITEKLDAFEKRLQTGAAPPIPQSSCNVHWTVSRPASTLFLGRDDVLVELETIVRDRVHHSPQNDRSFIVISGMGGQGKSEICLQLATRIRQTFWAVLWVDVSTVQTAEAGFLYVASLLSIPAQTFKDARHAIANLKQSWLLVLDNADDPGVDYQHYFPDSALGVVIMTSRNPDCEQYATIKYIPLGGLSDDHASQLLLRSARIPSDKHSECKRDADNVASVLHAHPLALIQAASYVSRGHCKLAEYPDVLQRHRKRLLAHQPAQAQSRYGDVYATLEASIEILQASASQPADDALDLLSLLASFAPSRLPLPLFEDAWKGARYTFQDVNDLDITPLSMSLWHISQMPSLIGPDTESYDSFRLVEAVHLLRTVSLVSTDTKAGYMSISMHPLVHAWASDRLDTRPRHHYWVSAASVVAASQRADRWPVYLVQMQPHFRALTACPMSGTFDFGKTHSIACLWVKLGWWLHDHRDNAHCQTLVNGLLAHLSLDPLAVTAEWVDLHELTGCSWLAGKRSGEAEMILRQVCRHWEAILPEDHRSRQAAQHNLASACFENKHSGKAEALLERVTSIILTTMSEEDGGVLDAQYHLARAYTENGNTHKALSLLQHIVDCERQTLRDDHPSLLTSMHQLAVTYYKDEQYTKAVTLLENVVRIEERSLPEDDSTRLTSQHDLANVYHSSGRVDEAVALLEKVVEIQKRSFAEDDISRLASQYELARAYYSSGRVDKAVTLLEKVVKIQERSLAEDNESRLTSQYELAIAYRSSGRYDDAVTLLENVVRIDKRIRAEDDGICLTSQYELARAYFFGGRLDDAMSLLRYVVRIRMKFLPETDSKLLQSQAQLALVYWDRGDLEAALQLMQHVTEVQKTVLDEEHPDRKRRERWLEEIEEETREMKQVDEDSTGEDSAKETEDPSDV